MVCICVKGASGRGVSGRGDVHSVHNYQDNWRISGSTYNYVRAEYITYS